MAELKTDGINLYEVREVIRKIEGLLADPHPGLFTWNSFLEQKLKELVRLIAK